jgi:hypothetical protein
MDTTPIDPTTIGAEHMHRIIEIGWPTQIGGKLFRSTIRGVLSEVTHRVTGTTLTVEVGRHTIHAEAREEGVDVSLVD